MPPEGELTSHEYLENKFVETIWKSPSYRKERISGADVWLNGKRADDDINNLWRIHDHLYDFTDYIKRHPGGQDWFKLTRGTDITEAFEAHHLSERPRKLLESFKVEPANKPRSSIYTFKENGFYSTLRRRARDALGVTSTAKHLRPTFRTLFAADALLFSVLFTGCLATNTGSTAFSILSGILLCLLTISGHNFFHQRDSFRMYYFDLSLMSSLDWRISHALSHHIFPNTMLDLEIKMFEPVLQFLPSPEKGFVVRYISWLYSPLIWTLLFHFEKIKRILTFGMDWRDAIPLFLPIVFWASTGFALESLSTALLTWTKIVLIASFAFGYIGLNAGHHHPEVYHAGDTPRKDCDWGLAQIDAIKDRVEVCDGAPELSLVTFGNHALHHLFPTVDNAHLSLLYPILFKTCKEFGINFTYGNFWITTKGQFQQLAKNKPNPNPPKS